MNRKINYEKKLFIVCFMVILALSVFCSTDTKAALKDNDWDFGTTITKTKSSIRYFAYPSKNGKEAWIYRISYHSVPETLSIPEDIDGRKVTRMGDPHGFPGKDPEDQKNILSDVVEFWENDKIVFPNRIRKVILPDTLEVMEPCTFGDFHRIETIKIPKNVTRISEYTFYRCKRLKKIILPDNLKELDPEAFYKCPNLKKLQLSSKNKKFQIKGRFLIARKSNALVFAAAGGKILKIPDGIKTVRKNACNNVTAPVVHLPASVRKLEENALTGLKIKDVTVAADNKVFQKDGQCIYRKKDKSLAVAIVDKDRNLYISENVEKITPEYSMVKQAWKYDYMQKVIFPKNLKSVIYPGFSSVAHARNIYFTGVTPPEITRFKKDDWMGYAELPIYCNIYVPKDSAEAYRAWYKKYNFETEVKWYINDSGITDMK